MICISIMNLPYTVLCSGRVPSTLPSFRFCRRRICCHTFSAPFYRETPHLLTICLFFAKSTDWIKTIIRNALGECHKNDSYSNVSCISWINLLFSTLLRGYSETPAVLQLSDGFRFLTGPAVYPAQLPDTDVIFAGTVLPLQ